MLLEFYKGEPKLSEKIETCTFLCLLLTSKHVKLVFIGVGFY